MDTIEDGLIALSGPQANRADLLGALEATLGEAVNPDFYRYVYGDPGADITAAAHYATVGWKEGRDPNPWFSTRHYLNAYADVAAAGYVPLFHFIERGAAEGKSAIPSVHAAA
jgi:hypothetical protein